MEFDEDALRILGMWMDMGLEVAEEDDKNGGKDDDQCETDGGSGTGGDNGEKDGNQGDVNNNLPTPPQKIQTSINISSDEDNGEMLAKTRPKKGPKVTPTSSTAPFQPHGTPPMTPDELQAERESLYIPDDE
ncbi:hypothetical protein ACHAQJ_007000 [Trichoderma viride]